MSVQTKWNVPKRPVKHLKYEDSRLEIKERAQIFAFFLTNTDQDKRPFLRIYDYVVSQSDYLVDYDDYEITETEPRTRTMKFTSSHFIDPTQGNHRILLIHPHHEAFYGYILDYDFDENTKLYTYQCQDGSRAYQGKCKSYSTGPITKYEHLKNLLVGGKNSKGETTYDAEYALSGLRKLEDYQQPAYGNVKAFNPLAQTMPQYLSYDSFIDQIRGIAMSDGSSIQVYFDKYGVCQIEPMGSSSSGPNTKPPECFLFSLSDLSANTYSFDKTNVITQIRVKRDKVDTSPAYTANDMFELNATFYFGQISSYLDAIDTTGLPTVQSQSTESNNNANTTNVATGTTSDVITVNMMPSCGCHGGKVAYKKYTKSYKNYCPMCKRHGTLTQNPKKVYEGEITCGNTGPACKTLGGASGKIRGCDADYCGYCGTEKNGTCRSRLTPATATATNTNTTGTTTNSNGTTTTTNTQVDYNSQEYQDREKQAAVDKIQESFVNMFDYKMTIPLNHPTFKTLCTDSYIYFELPKGWKLENIEKWGNLFFGASSFWTQYELNLYYIRSLKIKGDKSGTWAELGVSPLRGSRSSYTNWMRKTEQAYASAVTAQNNSTNNNTSTGGGTGNTGATGTLVKSTGNTTLDNLIKQWIAGKTSQLDMAIAIHNGLMKYGVKYSYYYNFPKSGGVISKAFQQAHNGLNCGDTAVLTVGSMRAAGIESYVGFRCDHYHFFAVMVINGTKYYSDLTANTGQYSRRAWNTVWQGNKCHSKYGGVNVR